MFRIGDLVHNVNLFRRETFGEINGIILEIQPFNTFTNYKVYWSKTGRIDFWYSDNCLILAT